MTNVIILAAGMGTRMGGETPKVLREIEGKAMIDYLLESVATSGVASRPIVVVESEQSLVKAHLGDRATYIIQSERRGTGHAVQICKSQLSKEDATSVLVLYGDMPFVSARTIDKLAREQEEHQCPIAMATISVPSFTDKYEFFADFGRIERDEQGAITQIIEKRDATPEQLKLTELNPGFYCFDAAWLWKHIDTLQSNNVQHEFYLTDLIKIAVDQGSTIHSYTMENPFEAIGVNTPDQLQFAHQMRHQVQ
jgi:bifunctional UDP-N-acetylglucosamine pyrophosphorylase / glucosamine-1-phosphate N-acetyltransferase